MELEWIDGVRDWWPLIDPSAQYEFARYVTV
jgi:hypothetical protein